jgi:holo-[acyl-carrier protein] synthase
MSGSQRLATDVAVDSRTSVRYIPTSNQQVIVSPSAIGVDIIDVQRLQALYCRWQEDLLTRLFTDQEQSICRKVAGYRWHSLAGRFSAKEAMKKILASHGEIAGWTEIEVLNGPYGEPYLNLYGRAKSAAERLGYSRLLLSISHDANLAIATVMAYK